MFEIDDNDNRDFITVYKKHYHPKTYSRVLKFIPPFNYEPPSNPINGPFKHHLNYSGSIKNKPIDDNKSKDIIEYFQKVNHNNASFFFFFLFCFNLRIWL